MSVALPIDFTIPDDYSAQAGATAVYPQRGNNYQYAVMGLAGEMLEANGEVLTTFEPDGGLCGGIEGIGGVWDYRGELGDILWYIAACCYELQWDLIELFEDAREVILMPEGWELDEHGLLQIQAKMGKHAGRCLEHSKKAMRDDANMITPERRAKIRPELVQVARWWCVACYVVGMPPEEVARRNAAKLRDRQQRGVLHGDGSHR